MIRVEGLTKAYGAVRAVNGLDLAVQAGEVVALLGPNGAGKSTTLKVLVGLVRPSGGRVLLGGLDPARDPRAARRLVGYLPQRVDFHDNLSAFEVLAFFARLRGVAADTLAPLLARVGLATAAHRRTDGFSGGMLQRLGLAIALLGDPPILILDEPTVGLDPEGALLFKEIIRERHAAGATVLVSSHLLNETQALTSHVAICLDGRVVAQATLAALRRDLALPSRLTVRVAGAAEVAAGLARSYGGRAVEADAERVQVELPDASRALFVTALAEAGYRITDLHTEDASLEEIFLATVRARKEPPR